MSDPQKITNPFPGLRPFETSEHRLFFGREGQSDALIERLARSRFLAVVGTSGSGKSSLVRAGLLPALRGGLMADAGSGWRIALMRPGSDPLGNLAATLAEDGVLSEAAGGLPRAEGEAVIEATLRGGALGLVEAARRARLSAHENLLVVVDQFEELFRFRAARAKESTGDDAAAFVKLLLEAAQQRDVTIYVVITMRSDFLGDCSQFQGLPEAINDGQYLIPRMTRDERRFAVTGPVRVARGKITEPLVSRLLNDVGDNPDQLPILQHALMRTWDEWKHMRPEHAAAHEGAAIDLCCYEAVGTMSDALSLHADEAYNELPEGRSRQVAEILFKALTERGADNREIRRPTPLKDICEIAGASEAEVASVVEVFRHEGRSFLMPPAGGALRPDTVIDISHESLIRNWERLKEWVRDEAESARIYRRLAGAATDYRAGAGGLLDDVTLQYVLKWREKYEPNRAWGARYHPEYDEAMAYLEESRAAREAAAEERERQQQAEIERERREREQAQAFADQQRRSARRMRWLAAGMAVMFLLTLGGAAYAYTMGLRAVASEKTARKAQEDAQKSEQEARRFASKLKQEKEHSEAIAANLDVEQKRKDEALTAQQAAVFEQQKALEAQKAATVRANAETKKAKAAELTALSAKADAEKAKTFAEKAKTDVERTARSLDISRARSTMHLLGIADFRRGDYEEALETFGTAALLLQEEDQMKKAAGPSANEALIKEDTAGVLMAYLKSSLAADTGAAHSRLGQYDKAVELYEGAVSQLQALVSEMKEKPAAKDLWPLFDMTHELGHAYRDLAEHNTSSMVGRAGLPTGERDDENFKKAEENYLKAVAIQEQLLKSEEAESKNKTLTRMGSFESIARLYRDLGRFEDAELYYKRVLEVRGKDPKSREYVEALKEVAQFYGDNNKYTEAASYYELAVKAQRELDDEADSELADIYGELGEVYASMPNEEARAALAFRLVNLHQSLASKTIKKDAAGSVKDLEQIGEAYERLGKFQWASDTYTRAIDLHEIDPASDTRLRLKRAALDYKYLKNRDRAVTRYKAVLAATATRGNTTETQARAMQQLGALYAETGNAAEGEPLLQTALKYWEKRASHPEIYGALSDLAGLYRRQKENDKLVAVGRRRVEAAGALLDSASPNTVAQKAWDAGEYAEAFNRYVGAVGDLTGDLLAHGKKSEAAGVIKRLLNTRRLDVDQVVAADALASYMMLVDKYKELFLVAGSDPTDANAMAASGVTPELPRKLLEQALAQRNKIQQITRRQSYGQVQATP